jgi:membrane protein
MITAVIGSVALSMIQLLGARLIAGASSNPLLAPFAAIIGVLLWFNIIAQVLMYCAAFLGECNDGRCLKRIMSKYAAKISNVAKPSDVADTSDSKDSTG